jgi:hypothetical protein
MVLDYKLFSFFHQMEECTVNNWSPIDKKIKVSTFLGVELSPNLASDYSEKD